MNYAGSLRISPAWHLRVLCRTLEEELHSTGRDFFQWCIAALKGFGRVFILVEDFLRRGHQTDIADLLGKHRCRM